MVPSLLSTPSSATLSVEKATSHLLMVPDWTMNMDICDAINTDPLHAKDFVKAVKKRLQNKNPRVQFLTLMLLETMIKNCGDFVHFQVVEREILQDMVKMSRRTADIQVRDKILVLLDSWQEAFGGAGGKYPQYYYAYAELKTSGIRFPQHQKDAALIYTPAVHTFHPHVGHGMPSNSVERLDESIENGILSLSDLKNIRSVMELFIDMLQAVNPQDRMALDDEVITDLASQCRINQKKLMQLINSTENEELLGEALALFENLQTALARYDALVSGSPLPPEIAHAIAGPNIIPPSAPMIQQIDDKDVEENESAHLDHRDANFKSTDDQLVSLNHSDVTAPTSTSGVSEASSSIASNALVLLDPPPISTTSNKEDDMIDLLSLVLSTEVPEASLPPPIHNQNPFLSSPDSQQYTNNPQPLGSNGSYATYGSYVAPWAQSPASLPPAYPQQQVMQYPYGYQSSSWIPTPGIGSNPFLSPTSFQYPAPQSNVAPVHASAAPPATSAPVASATSPATSAHPVPPAPPAPPGPPAPPANLVLPTAPSVSPPAPITALAPTSAPIAAPFAPPAPPAFITASAPASSMPVKNSMAIEKYKNPIGQREIQVNANNVKQTAGYTAPKPYIPPDKLFEGLIELRNPDGSLKSRNASTLWGSSGDVMTGGRK